MLCLRTAIGLLIAVALATNCADDAPTRPSHPSLQVSAAPSRIAFESDRDGNFEIYVMEVDGSALTRLTSHPSDDFEPSWSPNGRQIAFWSTRDGNAEIYVMNADGSAPTRLTSNPAGDAQPSWSPDGRQIAFMSTRDGDKGEVYVMGVDGSGQARLTNNAATGAFDGEPSWSPSGRQIAFTREPEIYVMDSDGSFPTQLTHSRLAASGPSWSPDGQHIAFADGSDIYVIDLVGFATRALTNDQDYNRDPSWSPDGGHIVFKSERDGNAELYVMAADGSGLTRLTNHFAWDGAPNWSSMRVGQGPPDEAEADRNGDLMVCENETTALVIDNNLPGGQCPKGYVLRPRT